MLIGSITDRHQKIIIILALLVFILAVYWQVQGFDFINYDDQLYVTHNFRIQDEITPGSISAAFTDTHTGHWHPLTMLSHMLDWQMFGDKAGGHHWTSLILHIINTVLLFLLLSRMTGAIWRSAIVASLFAIHPINVESVAWVAERKNVLSTFFWFLTMLFYVWYAEKPGWKRYLPVIVCFALGLMSKPMLVTLPFVLLLMDYWPLNRTLIDTVPQEVSLSVHAEKVGLKFLIVEKIPLFILTGISILLTVYAARNADTIARFAFVLFTHRMNNAIVSYALYLKKMFWPVDLAVFYPQVELSIVQVLPAALLIIVITSICWKYYKKYPYLSIGWFWYLGTLVPVIGIVQVGSQSMADRYAYVPFIGLFIALIWMAADMIRNRNFKRVAAVFLILLLAGLTAVAHRQASCWQNSYVLFERALQVTKGNFVAHTALGNELVKQKRMDEAVSHFREAISGNPYNLADYTPLVSLANALSLQGKTNEAITVFKKAININPKGHEAYYRLGAVYYQNNRMDEAIIVYQKAVALENDDPRYHGSLGNAYLMKGKTTEAIREYREVLRIQPGNIEANNNLGIVLTQQEKMDQALQYFQRSVRLNPQQANIHYYLYKILTVKGCDKEAQEHFKKAVDLDPRYKVLEKLTKR